MPGLDELSAADGVAEPEGGNAQAAVGPIDDSGTASYRLQQQPVAQEEVLRRHNDGFDASAVLNGTKR